MIDSSEELVNLLSTTNLSGHAVATLPILNTGESALAIDIRPSEIDAAWQTMRALVDKTGRWPIVSSIWGSASLSDQSLKERLADEEPFSRFFFKEAPGADDISPRGLIDKSKSVDVDEFIAQLDAKSAEEMHAEWLEEELDTCMDLVGRIPEQSELDHSIADPIMRVDRWIFDQLIALERPPEQEIAAFDWFTPDNAYLLLLPVTSGWEALAYCHFFGAYEGSEYYIAAGRRWEERFGAELVCHFGTMLQCHVQKPPSDPTMAWQLAREHDLLSSSTLAPVGVSVRDYARALIGMKRWFLHDRP